MNDLTLAELAIHVPGAIEVFEKYGIDFYHKGARNLCSACDEKNLDLSSVENEIEMRSLLYRKGHVDFNDLDLGRLLDHIENKYHAREKVSLRMIATHIRDILSQYPGEYLLHTLFTEYSHLMSDQEKHSMKEEKILFPYIRKLLELKKDKSKKLLSQVSLISNPIRLLEDEHEDSDELFIKVKSTLSKVQQKWPDEIEIRLLVSELVELERDFHEHLHLENNVLFPKLLELEKEMKENIAKLKV